MSKTKITVFGIAFLTMFIALGWIGAQQAAARSPADLQSASVNWHPQSGSGAVSGATARLVRTDRNIIASFHSKDLIPGHVYTLWLLIINNPSECADFPADCTAGDILFNTEAVQADVTYGGGIVAGRRGMGTLSGHMSVGELPNAWFGHGLQETRNADIHLVVNDHGPAIPGMVDEMLHTYRGGCTDDSLPPPFPATAKSDGAPGPNTCRLYQSATFQP
jgi:hypothetical protein